MTSRRAVGVLLALVVVTGSTTDARAGSGDTDGIDTTGDVPVVPTSTVGDESDDAPGGQPVDTDSGSPTDARSSTDDGSGAERGGVTSGAASVEKEVAVAPVIHCLWVTSDMDPDTPGTQHDQHGVADDLPDVPTPTPCGTDPESGGPVTVPTTDPMAHIRPWSADDPGRRTIEIWMIVSHAVGPEAVDGTEIALDGLGLQLADQPDPIGLDTAVHAGTISGQMTTTAAVELEQLVIDGWGIAVRSTVQLSYLDGCGAVALTGSASADGEISTVTASVDVPCYHRLLADFDHVAWGALVRGAETVVSGDHDRSTSGRPTLLNAGNTPIVLATTFAPLCSLADPQRCIGDFGVEVTGSDGIVHRIDPAPPGQVLLAPEPVACPGDMLRLDVVVSTPDTAVSGEYAGSMDMVGRSAEIDCTERPGTNGSSAPPPTDGPPSDEPPTTPAPPSDASTTTPGSAGTTTAPGDE